MQIKCPKCGCMLEISDKYMHDGGCSRCGTKLRIRNGKVYEQSLIANHLQYSMAIIFAHIARTDKINYDRYFKFFSIYLDMQTLTQSQYDDLINTFKSEC